jgi:DNA adenine methylase
MMNNRSGFRSIRRIKNPPSIDWSNFVPEIEIIGKRLDGVCVEHLDAIDLIRRYDYQDVLICADPPYVHATRNVRTGRYLFEMSDADHVRLAEVLNAASGMVVLSGYDNPLYDNLYWGWKKVTTSAYADAGAKRTECLWISPRAAAAATIKGDAV